MSRIHFIAIGGAVMHQLALALQRSGNTVSGSDDEINDPAMTNLKEAGLLPEAYGWYPDKITGELDAIVLGMHAKGDNPELLRAQELGVPVYSFPEYVYEVSKNKKRVVIAGSHGKTTVTSMVMHVLKDRGLDFDYLVGAKVEGFDGSVRLSDAPIIVLEGDEYPASVVEKRPKIFFYHPDITVLNGIAWDHVNVFPTYENYLSQFRQFLQMLKPGSPLFYNNTDPEVIKLVKEEAAHLNAQPYQLPVYEYQDGVAVLNTESGLIALSIFGSHNLVNMEAAKSVCNELGIDEDDFYGSISTFTGAARRLEKLGEKENLIAYRDFAHAPSKLKATLDAVREALPKHQLVAVFELHTYSSLSEKFLAEYKDSMNGADKAVVYYSHHALQLKGLPALDKDQVQKAFGNVSVFDEKESLANEVVLLSRSSKPVCLLLMSSGTFDGTEWKNLLAL